MSVFKQVAVSISVCCVSAFAADAPHGVGNFHKVSDSVYRGAQPSDEGFRNLARLGVKTVIDLRRDDEHSTAHEREAVEAAGMRYVNEPMQGIVAPDQDQMARILGRLNSGEPVFVHCREGKDRTGVVMASYRMDHDGWSSKEALHEANSFGMHWYEVGIKSYIAAHRSAPSGPVNDEAKLGGRDSNTTP